MRQFLTSGNEKEDNMLMAPIKAGLKMAKDALKNVDFAKLAMKLLGRYCRTSILECLEDNEMLLEYKLC